MNNLWRPTSNVKITVRDFDGNILDIQEHRNLLTTDGFNMVRDGLYGDVVDLQTKYMAVGDDSTAPVIADSTLGNETFRKIATSRSKPADAQVQFTLYLDPTEAIGTIEEIGWFAGAAAGAGADSGIMIARVLYSRVKTGAESITVERIDTFQEG